MAKLIDLTGKTFGLLTVISRHGYNADKRILWTCRCNCGNPTIKSGKFLKRCKELYCDNHPSKVCTECKVDKDKSEYHKCSGNPMGIATKCKKCMAKWYEENKHLVREKYIETRDAKRQRRKEISKKSRIKNREKQTLYKLKYDKSERVKLRKRKIHIERKATDIVYNIKRRLRWRVRDTLKKYVLHKNYKYESSLILLGCDMEFFKAYIESKFVDGMSWENISLWHIDHIKPCSKFDLTKVEEQKKCFHFSNLQPLFEKDNLVKSYNFPS